MSKSSAASLTASLLADKGGAIPAPFVRPRLPVAVGKTAVHGKWAARKLPTDPHLQRVKLSVRLDPARHLKLKLAAAHLHDSVQSVLIDALDAYLDQVAPTLTDGRCTCLRRKSDTVED